MPSATLFLLYTAQSPGVGESPTPTGRPVASRTRARLSENPPKEARTLTFASNRPPHGGVDAPPERHVYRWT
jgi:hypothetical protein